MAYANSTDPDQHMHLRCLIRVHAGYQKLILELFCSIHEVSAARMSRMRGIDSTKKNFNETRPTEARTDGRMHTNCVEPQQSSKMIKWIWICAS
ncbi:MAG: hypothetical protein ABW185_28620 [Sedimenticola sp.]